MHSIDPDEETFEYLISLYRNKDFYKAIEEAESFLAGKYNSAKILNFIGLCYMEINNFIDAEKKFNEAIDVSEAYSQPLNNLGILRHKQNNFYESIDFFKKAIDIDPQNSQSFYNLGKVYKDIDDLENSINSYYSARKLAPKNINILINLGNALKENAEYKESIKVYLEAITIEKNNDVAIFNLGLVYKLIGEKEKSEECYLEAIKINPHNGDYYRNLSLIRKFSENDSVFIAMRDLAANQDLNDINKSTLFFALAKAYEDIENYYQAFSFYQKGNSLRKKILNYDFSKDQNLFKKITMLSTYFDENKLNTANLSKNIVPIFIVGMPRSGTSLIEQIISSHPNVFGAGELNYVNKFYKKYFSNNNHITQNKLSKFRSDYLLKIERLSSGKRLVTDKMPHNFLHISLILNALPESKIIHVSRNPQAVCWSNFTHYFPVNGLGYSYGLKDVVNYYKNYKALMKFWEVRYPQRMYHVNYEELTLNQEKEIRNLITYLELPWNEKCLSPHKNKRLVKTASNQQVKRKIYSGSSESWKKFKDFLDSSFFELGE